MNKQILYDLLDLLRDLLGGLAPGAFGAAVSVATQTGLTWLQRFIQLAVGIIVSYYAGEAASELFGVDGVIKSGISFTFGVGAFEIVKNLRASLGEVAGDAPRDIWATIKARFGAKAE